MSVKDDDVYDESCYPGPGSATDSEDDIELKSVDQTSVTIDDSLPPADVSCSVCSDILIDPMSLHCGHTFCQLCLAQVWRSSGKVDPGRLSCPVCRLPWRNFPGINITLRYNRLHGVSCVDRMGWTCMCVCVCVCDGPVSYYSSHNIKSTPAQKLYWFKFTRNEAIAHTSGMFSNLHIYIGLFINMTGIQTQNGITVPPLQQKAAL